MSLFICCIDELEENEYVEEDEEESESGSGRLTGLIRDVRQLVVCSGPVLHSRESSNIDYRLWFLLCAFSLSVGLRSTHHRWVITVGIGLIIIGLHSG